MKKWFVPVAIILVAVIGAEALALNNVITLPWQKDVVVLDQGDPKTTNEVIEESLNGIGELYTMEYSYTMQSTTTNPMELLGVELPFGEKKLSYLYSGTLKVGVDLARSNTSVVGKVITVTFPELIAENSYDEGSIEFYDVKQYSFTRKALENYQASRIANLDDIKKRAEDLGIYEKAKENLTAILEKQFNAVLGQVGKGSDYTVSLVFTSDDVNYENADEED